MALRTLANFIVEKPEPEDNQNGGTVLFITNRISFFNAALVQSILGKDTLLIVEKKSFFKSLFSFFLKIRVVQLDRINKVAKIPGENLMFVPSSENHLSIRALIMSLSDQTEVNAIQGILIKEEHTWLKPLKLRMSLSRRQKKSTSLSGKQEMIDFLLTDLSCRYNYSDGTLISYLIKKIRSRNMFLKIIKDATGAEDSYFSLFMKIILLSKLIKCLKKTEQRVGVLLPNTNIGAIVFFVFQLLSLTPCMLNYTSGLAKLRNCLCLSKTKTIITSKNFINKAGLGREIDDLHNDYQIIFLEDLSKRINLFLKIASLFSFIKVMIAPKFITKDVTTQEACILFTTGSEGSPKGVVLTQKNLIANYCQTQHMLEDNIKDKVLNVLPFFHSFGLMAGLILPILKGTNIFQYPNPLHYKEIVKICREEQISILWGTPTFLKGYAEYAKEEDFKWLNYVVSGAEKLPEEIRDFWKKKFSINILEGYGTTETSPVIAVNNKFSNKKGTVGKILPMIDFKLRSVEGITEGKELIVKGPNIMQGYLGSTKRPKLMSTDPENLASKNESYLTYGSWYETGDLVSIDENGFLTIVGRIKRFAKLGGEMVSLSEIEAIATRIWPSSQHAAISVTIDNNLETIILFTTEKDSGRKKILEFVSQNKLSNLMIPKVIEYVEHIPIFGSGKTDYQQLAEEIRTRCGN
ncbi:AMP-binding protein [Pseudomonadota bacterium]|nr:AMP-binding protein [Pseudomonadota bacterium]